MLLSGWGLSQMVQDTATAEAVKLTLLEDADRTLGVDELNLAEFPICSLSTRTEPGQSTLLFEDEIFDESSGKRVQRSLVIAGSEHFGLPTSTESDVLLVLIHLSNVRSGFKDRKVPFSRYELIKFLGWDLGGKSYERLDHSLRRWTSVTLHYKHAWWDRGGKKWRTRSFHVLESLELRGKDEFADDGLSSFMWNEVIFNSFQAGNLKRINLDIYFRIQSAVAKQIYRFADKRFYQRRVLVFPLRTFACEHIGLSRNYDNFDLKRKLLPALAELEGIGFLKPHSAGDRFVKLSPSNWEIRLERAGAPTESREAPSPLVSELTKRGVNKTTAINLTRSFAAGHITGKIAMHDELLAKRDRRIGKNPPGFLASSIRDNYQVPNRSIQNALTAGAMHKPLNDKSSPAQLPTAADNERTAQLAKVRAYCSQLSDTERQELESQAVARGNPFHVASYQRLKATGSRLWESLRDELVADYLSKNSFPL